MNQAEERIPEDRQFGIIQSEENKEKRMKRSKESLSELYSTIKRTIYTSLVCLRRREGERGRNLEERVAAANKSLWSCLTLYNPVDCSLPASSVHGILQASIMEWVAMPSFRGSS